MADKVRAPVFRDAVQCFWDTRSRQATSQAARGTSDQGARGAVTGGQQMNGFLSTIVSALIKAGVDRGQICSSQCCELPGFFRPTKEWDLVVVRDGQLLAALELKSQVGPSFGNNFNNRTEEAMGSALDIWTAYREGAFRTSPSPWLGYLLLLEDCDRSRLPIKVREPHFPVFPEFRMSSYARRYELFCRKLVRERTYNSACFLLSRPNWTSAERNYAEPAEDLGADQFMAQLLAHVVPWSSRPPTDRLPGL